MFNFESGMHKWLPDQVYRSKNHTTEVLEYLIEQYNDLESPAQSLWVLGICLRITGELIGHVGLSPLRNQVEIGFAIEEEHQRYGYATEAVSAISQWGFWLTQRVRYRGQCKRRVMSRSGEIWIFSH